MSSRFGKVLQNFARLPENPPQLDQPPPVPTPEPLPPREGKRVGRPRGKKSNPGYVQVTVYLRRDIHVAAKKTLLEQRREFSGLVEELVDGWNKTSGR